MPSEQAMRALDEANRIRRSRYDLYRALRAGDKTIAELLEHADMQRASIAELLRQQQGWGMARTRKLLAEAGGISEIREIGSLTERQKVLIVDMLSRPRRREVAKGL